MSLLFPILIVIIAQLCLSNAQLTASAVLSSSISIDITIDLSTNQVDITLKGSTDNWFGVGFNTTAMPDSYAIIASGGHKWGNPITYEITLDDDAPGTKTSTQMISVYNDQGSSNIRTIEMKRDRIGIDKNHYTFPEYPTTINIIWAEGPDDNYCCTSDQSEGTSMKDHGITTLTFTGTGTLSPTAPTAPTAPTTAMPTSTTTGLIATKTLVSSHNFDIEVNIDLASDTMTFTISGPSDIWFGVGFGKSMMSGCYAIIMSGNTTIQERKLGNDAAGSVITSSVTVETDTISGSTRTVILSRDRIGIDLNHYTFPSLAENIPIIYAYGTSNSFVAMQYHNSGTLSFISQGNTMQPTLNPTTEQPTTPLPTPSISADCDVSANSVINAEYGITITACIDLTTDMIDILISGPMDKWYGIGFGHNNMTNTYAIIADDNVEEYKLGHHTAGNILSSSINITNDSVSNGWRHIHVSRARALTTSDFYSFPDNTKTIDIIWAVGTVVTFIGSGMYDRGITTLSFIANGDTLSPTMYPTTSMPTTPTTTSTPTTPFPTSPVSSDCDVSENSIISTDYGVAITVCINLTTDMIDILVSGPTDKWYGIGFGNNNMTNTYSIIADDGVDEYKLGHHVAGNILNSSISIINDSISNGWRHIHISRARVLTTSDFYSFPDNTKTIDIIWAVGTAVTFIGSAMYDRGISTLSFIANGDTLSPTIYPTTSMPTTPTTASPTKKSVCIDTLSASQDVGEGFELLIGFTIDCVDNTMTVDIKYGAYNPNWLGIVFGDHMIPDNGYNTALILTTGKSNDRAARFYTYHLSTTRAIDYVIYQPALNWTMLGQQVEGTTISAIYMTPLSNTKWTTSSESIQFRYAYGSSLTLKQHIATSNIYTYNIVTGEVNIEEDDMSLQIGHGIIMYIAWSVFASVGIMSSRFRKVIEKCMSTRKKALWFLIHRSVQISVVLLVLIGFSICIYFTDKNNDSHFDCPHAKLGLTVVIIGVLQPFNAYIRPHPPSKGEHKPITRFIWEIVHKGLGYSAWCMGLINIYLGLTLPEIYSSQCRTLYIVWIVIVITIYIGLWIYDYWLSGKQEPDTIGVGLLDNDVAKKLKRRHKQSDSVELPRHNDNSNNNDNTDEEEGILNNAGNTEYQLLENEQL